MDLKLNDNEVLELFKQPRETRGNGGFQSLLVKLQDQYDQESRRLRLYEGDIQRIIRYYTRYGQGGWQDRLDAIFSRFLHLMNKNLFKDN